jgi:cytoskeletal protein CcmA (bactofilin family)
MASKVSVIGRSTRVRGRVTGTADVDVQGFVDGEIAVVGDVTVDAHGMVGAGIRGRRLVVRGAVRGDLIAEEAVLLEDGARVVGDVRAPRVAIAAGALVRGFVETGESNETPAHAARPLQAARVAPPAVAVAPRPAAVIAPRPAAAVAPRPAPTAATPAVASPTATPTADQPKAGRANAGANSGNSVPRRPPPPIVPALKKVKGQIAKRKER